MVNRNSPKRKSAGGTPTVSYAGGSRRFYAAPATANASSGGPDAWVMTYMDLVTLLLTLFIFLLLNAGEGTAGSEKNEDQALAEFQTADEGILKAANALKVEPLVEPSAFSPFENIRKKLQQQLALSGFNVGVEIEQNRGSLQVQFSEKILFNSGKAHFSPRAVDAITPVIEVLQDSDYFITVEGHTDNIPIFNEQFPSNWELSAARAAYLVRYLISEGIAPEYLRAIGYADTRPIESNNTESGRRRNRRVTLTIRDGNEQKTVN